MVVGPGLVSTSPVIMGPHAQNTVNRVPIGGGGRYGSTNFHSGLPDRCDSSIVCMLCRLELYVRVIVIVFL